ncbi:MAG TPA: Rne/Rng family ribonuclease [Candidatus Saccharimonadales bacterium]|nr:Rne/Rng family ribonuclease [Candidatus Saccharimonadales bacterium]
MKKIIINKSPWETRIAIVRDSKLENLFFGQSTDIELERSFFKGKVSKILPGIQTAFVDIGQERAGFLHISEIDHDLALSRIMGTDQVDEIKEIVKEGERDIEEDVKPRMSSEKMDISKILHEGEDLLVQVSKEPVDEKGAKLKTCFTLPGRFIVLTPNIPRIGVSKKIEDRAQRLRLKEIISKHLPAGMGAVIRTSAEGKSESEIQKDLSLLTSDWDNILALYKKAESKTKIYEDVDLSLQVVRDHLDGDIEEIITDNKENHNEIYKYLSKVAPEFKYKVKLYEGSGNLFDRYDIDPQIKRALEKKVTLKSGGSIVVETTEALTVIDVNTGKFVGKGNLEETILKTNLEAAREIVLQLKLRNIGGLIVIDFIDMINTKNKLKLVSYFEQTLKELDKFQAVVLQVSEFGIVQMTRKRSGKTLMRQLTDVCHCCSGLGRLPSVRAESYEILRKLKVEIQTKFVKKNIFFEINAAVFDFITSIEFNSILQLEKDFNCTITLVSNDTLTRHHFIAKEK